MTTATTTASLVNLVAADGTVCLNFAACEAKARRMSVESLEWSIADCRDAIAAMPDGPKAGFYADEIHVYLSELAKRIGA